MYILFFISAASNVHNVMVNYRDGQIDMELVWMWFANYRDHTVTAEVWRRQATDCHDESCSQVSAILSKMSIAWQTHIQYCFTVIFVTCWLF